MAPGPGLPFPGFLRILQVRARPYWQRLRMYLLWVPEWRYRSLPRYLRKVELWRKLDPGTATIEQLWKGIREMSRADAEYWYRGGVWNAFALTRGFEFELHNFLAEFASEKFTSGQFLSGLPSPAFDGQLALWQISQQIRHNQQVFEAVIAAPPVRLLEVIRAHPEGDLVSAALDAYFAKYGHQVFTLDFVEPCEAESPSNTLKSLHALLLQEDYDPISKKHELAARRAAAEQSANSFFKGRTWLRFRWPEAFAFYHQAIQQWCRFPRVAVFLLELPDIGQNIVQALLLGLSGDNFPLCLPRRCRRSE
jgi:hypothetical protein